MHIRFWLKWNHLPKKSVLPKFGRWCKPISLDVLRFVKSSNSHEPLLLALISSLAKSVKGDLLRFSCNSIVRRSEKSSLAYCINKNIVCLEVLSYLGSRLLILYEHLCNSCNSSLIDSCIICQCCSVAQGRDPISIVPP